MCITPNFQLKAVRHNPVTIGVIRQSSLALPRPARCRTSPSNFYWSSNMAITRKAQRRTDELLGIRMTRPLLAIAAFLAPFAITAVGTWLDFDHFLVVVPCAAAAIASTLLCIQLLGGSIIHPKWVLLAGLCFTVYAGQNWYVFAALTAGVLLCLAAIDRYVGHFTPIFEQSSNRHRVFPKF